MGAAYTLRREQWIGRPVEEVFEFFSQARNLEGITPPWLGFRILPPVPERIEAGTVIRYRLSLHGLPVRWTTEIRVWEPPFRFVDVQVAGPYRIWHHSHRFEAFDGGTRMIDVVRYRLPFGVVGRVAHRFFVRRDVERIFEYRRARVGEMWRLPEHC